MKFHNTVFFCERSEQPVVEINPGDNWKYAVRIRPKNSFSEGVYIYIRDLIDLTNFKNSFDEAFNKAFNQAINTLEPITSNPPDSSELVNPVDDLGDSNDF